LKQVQASSESHIILDCDKEKIIQILRQAKEVKMMEDYQSYFIVTLVKQKSKNVEKRSCIYFYQLQDLHTIDMEDFKYVRTNITSLRMVDPNSQEVQNVVQDWIFGEMRKGRVLTLTAQEVTVMPAFPLANSNFF
jgi:glutamate receptor, ionotropic, invertebrate